MLPSPRIVVIDDEKEDVQAIVEALITLQASAVGIHYTPERELPRFPCLRILFLDLHLLPGAGSTEQQVKNTVDLLPRLLTSENGPYAIVLWSLHPTERERFGQILEERLPVLEITAPLMIVSLDKSDHLLGHDVKDPAGLRDAVLDTIRANPQLAALLAWEEHVAQAVNDTICQIFQMAQQREPAAGVSAALNSILAELAVATAGTESAREDVFRPTNEILVQIVSDRLLHRGIESELSQLWKEAVTDLQVGSRLTEISAARLNSLLYLEAGKQSADAKPWGRGSVLNLAPLSDDDFLTIWGRSKEDLLKEFNFQDRFLQGLWIAIQVQAPCDEVQLHPGLLPYVLGISLVPPSKTWLDKIKKAKHLWLSPKFMTPDNEICCLIFHLRFVAGFSRERLQILGLLPVCCRLREPLMTELRHELHSYGGRPGVVKFPR